MTLGSGSRDSLSALQLGALMAGYRDLLVWQRAIDLACVAYKVTQAYPNSERFGLISQTRRAAVSVSCNIAEGQGRARRGEFLNQLSVARGSLQELESLFIVAQRLQYITAEVLQTLLAETDQISRMLLQLRRSLS